MPRTVIIGDVHGCSRELAELLELLQPGADDRVHFVGDLISRGPDSAGVLSLFRQVRGRAVRGNHEQRLLEAHRARLRGHNPLKLRPHHHTVLKALSDDDWALLESLPLYMDLEQHDLRIVHAGVLPGVPFEKQEAWTLTHIRSVLPNGAPSDKLDGGLWGELYADGPHVVFGHNSRRQLQLHPRATGIDTGCVYGGSLTALVLAKGQHMPCPDERRELLVSVPARAAYYRGV